MFKMYTQKMLVKIKNHCKIRTITAAEASLSQPVLCTFYNYSSSLMIFEIMKVNRVAEPCCTIFKVKTCLQFNCGYLHLPQVKSKHGFSFRSEFIFDLLCLCIIKSYFVLREFHRMTLEN